MGDYELKSQDLGESQCVIPPFNSFISNESRYPAIRTVFGGQFDWGGFLLKSNVRFQRSPHAVWKSAIERNGKRRLYCETYKSSNCESRA